MSTKKNILLLHKVLGLTTGIVVFIVAITGCCWAFRDEIESLYDDYKEVAPQTAAIITPSEAKNIATEVFPNHFIHGTLYKNSSDAVEVIFYDAEPEFYQTVYLHPYSGEVIHIEDHLSGFFAFVLKGHMRLWLPKEIGEQVVGVSILLFIVIIISGFILWLPKKRKNLKQRLKFDWKASTRWKRKNFDLHSIIGFYICAFGLVIAFTGSIMSYQWLNDGVYNAMGGNKISEFMIPTTSTPFTTTENEVLPMDFLIEKLKKEAPNADSYELHYPHTDTSSIYVEVSYNDGLYYNADYRFFDPATLQEIETPSVYGKYENASMADKIIRMNYDIHVGAIGGITGKIIAFLVSLLIASLPVTGALMYYGRNFKKKKNIGKSN